MSSAKVQPDEDDGVSCGSSLSMECALDRDWLSASLERLYSTRQRQRVVAEVPNHNVNDANIFTIVTWNIWFSRYEWQARLEEVILQSILYSPNVVCFQEVTAEVHNCMLRCQYLRDRYEPTERTLGHGYDTAIWIKKDVGLNRWNCKSIPLNSIFGRRGLSLDLEISNNSSDTDDQRDDVVSRVRVVSTHLESGREHAFTRERQLEMLFSYIQNRPWSIGEGKSDEKDNQDHPEIDASFLVGDFNFDPTERENTLVEPNGIDIWRALRQDDAGYTEDTFKNKMRYLAHGKHKQARYDRVVLVKQSPSQSRFNIHPLSIDLLGDKAFDEEGEIWPSDHFGLVAFFELLSEKSIAQEDFVLSRSEPSGGFLANQGYETP